MRSYSVAAFKELIIEVLERYNDDHQPISAIAQEMDLEEETVVDIIAEWNAVI